MGDISGTMVRRQCYIRRLQRVSTRTAPSGQRRCILVTLGDGYLRIMTFQPNGAINVSSYSPYLKTYRTDGDNAFTLSL